MTAHSPIPFSPPDISEAEIAEVVDTLTSGWITTGPKTKQLERELAAYIGTAKVACLNSATAALECALRALEIGPGDEVITSAYTYTASCSPICHVGATPVLCDTAPDSYEMNYEQMSRLITPRTKAIIPIDIAGRMCDYNIIFSVAEEKKNLFVPANEIQETLGRVAIVADGAHALGSTYHNRLAGTVADFTTFSFHAVKNFTTAEGGALTWQTGLFDDEELYRQLMLLSLHGQTKDALAKTKAGAWEYDVAFPGWKCNMTDIQAALGLAQLKRYPQLLSRRRQLIENYEQGFAEIRVEPLKHFDESHQSSGHLMLIRLTDHTMLFRNTLIERLGEDGIAANVHYKPLPLLSAYRDLGFSPQDFPCSIAQYENEISLPLHTLLTDDDQAWVIERFIYHFKALEAEGVR